MEILINHFLKNERLLKLLYYDTTDALERPTVPQEKVLDMFGKQIKIVPKLKIDKPEFCYLIISFDNFTQNMTNPAFRDNIVSFDIVCHFNQWNLKNPLGECTNCGEFCHSYGRLFHVYLNLYITYSPQKNKKLTGIGTLQFLGANQIVLSDEFAGLTLMYQAIHGYQGEDSKNALKPEEQENIELNWDKIFNIPDEL